ncbi:MAG: sulfotransferase family protein [Acidobacteriota bacterium]|nr:sulfotransferase family protein [Acidobacteriota bacterium]
MRNPWDRLVSAYTFLKRGGMNDGDKKWAARNLAKYDDFDSFVKGWVNRRNIWKGLHMIPQYEFVSMNNTLPLVDFIGRLERMEEDFNLIRAKLGVEGELLKLNMSSRRDYRELYTDETKQIVADAYREDIEIFEYDFESTHYR